MSYAHVLASIGHETPAHGAAGRLRTSGGRRAFPGTGAPAPHGGVVVDPWGSW